MESRYRISSATQRRQSPSKDVREARQDSEVKNSVKKPLDDKSSCSLSVCHMKYKLENAQDDTKEHIEDYMQLSSILFPTDGIQKSNPTLRLSWAFVTILEYFQHDQRKAKREIRHALELAQNLNDTHAIARCFYWLGRIAFCGGRFHKAFYYFEKAKPNLDSRISNEEDTVDLYLLLCSPSVSQEYRKRLLLEYNLSVAELCFNPENQRDANDRASLQFQSCRKRKREQHDIAVIFRPSSRYHSRYKHMGDRQINQKKSHMACNVVWMIPNTDDLNKNQHPESLVNNGILDPANSEQMLHIESGEQIPSPLRTQISFIPLARQKRAFTFRCYHVGLSGPRARSFGIFPLQSGEPALSIEEGNILADAMKEKIVTMAYLRRERGFLMERASICMRQAAETKDGKQSLQ
ncbi:uncharacterized protein N7469_009410 [Penicillium citrinum]|uniref:Uncharacterized protein n=1 Tax=Penicillium citrinum TaxID=5077 RepID=A0A9W9NNK5_PENCI|nr:uncharacterized protein N7469_009410 [Penicillium citrinum]KAJ5223170.1 hypothetical protein N7469_009410 [Penicillium citrinum]